MHDNPYNKLSVALFNAFMLCYKPPCVPMSFQWNKHIKATTARVSFCGDALLYQFSTTAVIIIIGSVPIVF